MSAMEQFKTRERAGQGRRLTLYTPDGVATEHWLQVRHVWSDAFSAANEAELSAIRELVLAAEGDKGKIADAQRDAKFRLWAALVAAWSFDVECTPESVEAFLREAPQIGTVLDKFATETSAFFGKDSNSSTAGSSLSEP